MRISIVIPTYNERGTIKALLTKIFQLNIPGLEVIVVDDSSSDGTIETVRMLKRRLPLTLVLRPKKMGLGSALRDGLTLAMVHGAQRIITMDGDLSHDPAQIPDMVALSSPRGGATAPPRGEADLVVGSRRIAGGRIVGWGVLRTLMSRGAMEMARRILHIQARDVTSGFRLYRKAVLDKVKLASVASTGYAFQEELLWRAQRAGFNIVEIPIVFHDRRHGKSKLGVRDILEFFWTVVRLKIFTSKRRTSF